MVSLRGLQAIPHFSGKTATCARKPSALTAGHASLTASRAETWRQRQTVVKVGTTSSCAAMYTINR